MDLPRISRDHIAVAAALTGPLAAAAALVPVRTSFANTDAALVLVAVVVAVAATGARAAGNLAAAGSAIWFDFFLTQPYEQFTITRRSDIETTLLLLIIGVAVTELAVWGRRQAAAASRRAGYVSGLHAAAEAAAAAQRSPDNVIRQVSDQLTRLLHLQSCQFQRGYSGVGGPARLNHDGQVTVDHHAWPVDRKGLPPGKALELLVESGGVLQGRFLMTPTATAHPTRENRLVAALLADQVGAAFAGRPSAGR
ncbi:MAG TPA: DUF4118 domain-containing protein [Streptosporangiaceae bacterium]|jgi:K+-sensing histidine kinase KdpD